MGKTFGFFFVAEYCQSLPLTKSLLLNQHGTSRKLGICEFFGCILCKHDTESPIISFSHAHSQTVFGKS
ncbi:hypothetical protein AQUCO_03200038v1 [Aquilegia coerulea]|uniref:Uncharacterized protein n=1 Tax=Aquilegia coerulea TaxID=218851 RepID=A0A2G5CZT3_AQUCA|nr:hypothetical protein AQUCO_03200038v1 [Aquilegia coerulea]PIA36782.1 hypothetical protein AQUCO_03200038v1 [Aquilegia coerulea]